ncbi:peptidoglycan hydrolase-like protein with peptidoglycan-binding domain [Rhodanobacter sp. K2T2]|uniref:peptidoglycan-binding domain-containing protein n=1 Tax=Rhodanobacter sp. K2T2 TaxID=2723085 RepID=UPI0015C8E0A9|nr:peptidoglycan-binding domain-containing protein [Rhodanobacter sp. K2T2]NYE30372.1 peptidoglycan hydrolase-like protein with peptidoglycan-binding domain [Rhodanobacter sp. K2T2]
MTDRIDTRNIDSTAGAVYFVVGRGTEGGPSDSYRLSVAGVRNADWGDVSAVASNSGYSIGTIQVDLGQQGLRPLGSASDRPLKPGEKTYVDAIIEQSSAYAKTHNLPYTGDLTALRKDLLSHGDGQGQHSSIHFIDTHTRDSINQWASSSDGKQWIHQNVDYPQIKSITADATAIVDKYGKNIPEDRRFETICILAKTENQIPGKIAGFEKVLKDGGNYDDVLKHADALRSAVRFYDGPKAATIAEAYDNAYGQPGNKEALDRANRKVSSATYDPSSEKTDPDIQAALKAIGQSAPTRAHHDSGALHSGSHGKAVGTLQSELAALGYTDTKGHALKADGDFGPGTKAALEAFQRDHHLTVDGVAGPKTLAAIHQQAKSGKTTSLEETSHPDHALYVQAQKAVYELDARMGRKPDQHSDNLAAALTVAAKREGVTRIDQVVLNEDGSRAYAVQNDAHKHYAQVQTAQAVHTPVAQSSQALQTADKAPTQPVVQQSSPQQAAPSIGM